MLYLNRFILLAAIVYFPSEGFAQLFYTVIDPSNPVENANVNFVTGYYSTSAPVYNVFSNYSLSNDTVNVYTNFCKDDSYNFSDYNIDTIPIGTYPAGVYTIHYTYDVTLLSNNCIPINSVEHFYMDFTVAAASSTEENWIAAFQVYPNPASVYFQHNVTGQVDLISLIDMQGRSIRSYDPGLTRFSVEGLQAGFYMVILKSGVKEYRYKLFIQP